MTSTLRADDGPLWRKACRLLGAEQLAALTPSQRALMALMLNDLLETRGASALASSDDVRMIFEHIAGFPPVIREGGLADDAF